jgi:hypothetical protein
MTVIIINKLRTLITMYITFIPISAVEPFVLFPLTRDYLNLEIFKIFYLLGVYLKMSNAHNYLALRKVWNPIDFLKVIDQRSRSQGLICTLKHNFDHSRINIFQWPVFLVYILNDRNNHK